MNRIRYRAAGFFAAMLLSVIPGCARQASSEAVQAAAPDAVEIVSRDFSHAGYVDSIAFLLPDGWTFESYERTNAGEDMDPREWGFQICIGGEDTQELYLLGSRQTGEKAGKYDLSEETPEAVHTGAGLTGKRYTRQITLENGEVRQEYYVLFDAVAGSSAVYQVYASLSPEEYEERRAALDSLVAGISIAAVAKAQ